MSFHNYRFHIHNCEGKAITLSSSRKYSENSIVCFVKEHVEKQLS